MSARHNMINRHLHLVCLLLVGGVLLTGSSAPAESPDQASLKDLEDPPTIMVTYSWSANNIGDIGITPGLLNLLDKYVPEAEIILVTASYYEKTRSYLAEHYPEVEVIPNPFSNSGRDISRPVFKSIQIPPSASPFHGIPEEEAAKRFQDAFDRADMVLFNSGTTLSFGRYGHGWHNTRSMKFAVPLFMAREAGKAYGVYCQSFERFAWPSNKLFVPMLSDADFVFCRDGNSLAYLKDLGVNPPVLEFGPDATFGFDIIDKTSADAFMQEHGLEPGNYITLTIRSAEQGFVDAEREQAHAEKMRELIRRYVQRTGNRVLICPEVRFEIEPARRLILEPLSEETRQHVAFLDEFWEPKLAYTVYSEAEAIVSMEAHSIIMALGVGTPVLHPRFLEAGRKAWMLEDLGLGDWLFDIDTEPVDPMFAELMKIHNNHDTALAKVESAMDTVRRRQKETMAVVRETLKKAVRNRD